MSDPKKLPPSFAPFPPFISPLGPLPPAQSSQAVPVSSPPIPVPDHKDFYTSDKTNPEYIKLLEEALAEQRYENFKLQSENKEPKKADLTISEIVKNGTPDLAARGISMPKGSFDGINARPTVHDEKNVIQQAQQIQSEVTLRETRLKEVEGAFNKTADFHANNARFLKGPMGVLTAEQLKARYDALSEEEKKVWDYGLQNDSRSMAAVLSSALQDPNATPEKIDRVRYTYFAQSAPTDFLQQVFTLDANDMLHFCKEELPEVDLLSRAVLENSGPSGKLLLDVLQGGSCDPDELAVAQRDALLYYTKHADRVEKRVLHQFENDVAVSKNMMNLLDRGLDGARQKWMHDKLGIDVEYTPAERALGLANRFLIKPLKGIGVLAQVGLTGFELYQKIRNAFKIEMPNDYMQGTEQMPKGAEKFQAPNTGLRDKVTKAAKSKEGSETVYDKISKKQAEDRKATAEKYKVEDDGQKRKVRSSNLRDYKGLGGI